MLNITIHGNKGFQANLSLNKSMAQKFSPVTPAYIDITSAHNGKCNNIERYIEDHFRAAYGAYMQSHYPCLMSVHDQKGNIIAAVGFRYAATESLFLEQYLDEPIEDIVSNTHEIILRKCIVETGNLVSSGHGASIFLFAALNTYLAQQGMQVNVVTATSSLQRFFRKLGLKSQEIAKADQLRLSDKGVSWGDYYQKNPNVIAGKIDQIIASLAKHLQMTLATSLVEMHPMLHVPPSRREA